MLPIVSILIPTYRRVDLLAECLESARRQTYQGKLDVVVLNDDPTTTLRAWEYPVRIVNTTTRFATLGDKRTALMDLARGDLVQWWDDDDIALPNHVAKAQERLCAGREPAIRMIRVYGLNGDTVTLQPSEPLCGVTMTAHAMREVGAFPSIDLDEDFQWRNRALTMRWFHGEDHHVAHHAPTFIHRAHSGPRATTHTRETWDSADRTTHRGEVGVLPRWSRDFVALTRNFAKVPV